MSPSFSESSFLDSLETSIAFLKASDFNSAWLPVPVAQAALVAQATALGFKVHHANASEQTIVMKKWLRDTEDKIPPFATHQVGCAGFVLNDENELLVIKEWSGPPSARVPSKQWKLPGGMLDKGEAFGAAACREVLEETGVKCDFEGVLALWNRHGLSFGVSDIYVVCMLRPLSSSSSSSAAGTFSPSSSSSFRPPLNIDPVEVSAARWMPLSEFVHTQPHPLIRRILEISFGIKLPPLDELLVQGDDGEDDSRRFKEAGGGSDQKAAVVVPSKGAASSRLRPRVALQEFPVTFGNRPPIPTFLPVANDKAL